MKLPRWLSPVRTVQAETGWPRAFSKQFARRIAQRSEWRDLPWFLGMIPLCWLPLIAMYLIEAPLPESGLEWVVFWLLVPLAAGLAAVPFALYVNLAMSRKTRRFLRRYLPEPWCFKCKYPIPPPREGRSYSICPECGEPIPPEIARLTAERASHPHIQGMETPRASRGGRSRRMGSRRGGRASGGGARPGG